MAGPKPAALPLGDTPFSVVIIPNTNYFVKKYFYLNINFEKPEFMITQEFLKLFGNEILISNQYFISKQQMCKLKEWN